MTEMYECIYGTPYQLFRKHLLRIGLLVVVLITWPVFAHAEIVPKIMTLGDSITGGGDGAYRRPLFNSILSTPYHIEFVGTRYSYSTCEECRFHEAYAGWTPYQILNGEEDILHLSYRLSSVNPDIVIIHAGTNGCELASVTYDPETELYGSHVKTMKEILDTIFSFKPQMKVILAQIIQRQIFQPEIHEFNKQLALMYANYQYKDAIILVNLEETLTETADYIDMYHPSDQGFDKMAQAFALPLVSQITDLIREEHTAIAYEDGKQYVQNNPLEFGLITIEEKDQAVVDAEAAKDVVIAEKESTISSLNTTIATLFTQSELDQAVADAEDIIIADYAQNILYLLYGDFDMNSSVDGLDLSLFSQHFGHFAIDVDNDGDGYTEIQGDCNDNSHVINPDASEICIDGIDNNCDGQIDEVC